MSNPKDNSTSPGAVSLIAPIVASVVIMVLSMMMGIYSIVQIKRPVVSIIFVLLLSISSVSLTLTVIRYNHYRELVWKNRYDMLAKAVRLIYQAVKQ